MRVRRRQQQREMAVEDQQSKVLDEVSALVFSALRSPPSTFQVFDLSPGGSEAESRRKRAAPTQISPSGFASLLFGISVSMMLCGSLTLFIGFMLMPWVIGLVLVFYAVGIVSAFSLLGRAILVHAIALATPRKTPVPCPLGS